MPSILPRLPEGKDRRIKIRKSEYNTIKRKHIKGMAIRAIAREYGVDKRLIQFILFPERKALNIQQRTERGGSKIYYNRDKWRLTMREHRRYKATVFNINRKNYGY